MPFFTQPPLDHKPFLIQFINHHMAELIEELRDGPANKFVMKLVDNIIERLNNPEQLSCPFKHLWNEIKNDLNKGNINTIKLIKAIQDVAEVLNVSNEALCSEQNQLSM